MIDLGTYKDRFAESGQRVFEHAVQESRRRDQNYIAVEHILNALANEEADLFNSTMRDLSLDPRSVKVLIEKRLENARYQNVNKGIRIAPETIELFKRAMERARAQGRKTIEATDLFMALSQDERSVFDRRAAQSRRQPRDGRRAGARARPHARAGGGAVQEEVRAAALPQALRRLPEQPRAAGQDPADHRPRAWRSSR